jgi:hypothetical protein
MDAKEVDHQDIAFRSRIHYHGGALLHNGEPETISGRLFE